MGKRSNFKRNPRDFYPTPYEAVKPLLPHLTLDSFVEPCAGDGCLVRHLTDAGLKCILASDIEPMADNVVRGDVFDLLYSPTQIITNPPWDRKILHPMIEHFKNLAPTWLLFDSDWMHTKQSAEYIKYCSKIISVGRVKWIPDSKYTGKDNCAWYFFGNRETTTEFVGR